MTLVRCLYIVLLATALSAGVDAADAWRSGTVCRTRMQPPRPAVQRVHPPYKLRNVIRRAAARAEQRMQQTTRTSAPRTATGRPARQQPRAGGTTPRSTPREPTGSVRSRPKVKVDFVDKDKDGYDDRARVDDL